MFVEVFRYLPLATIIGAQVRLVTICFHANFISPWPSLDRPSWF
jgi:hypothetical protein